MIEALSAALRFLRRNVEVSGLAIVLLSLSMTAIATAFTLTSAVVMVESPFPNIDRLWSPRLTMLPSDGGSARPLFFTYPDFVKFKQSQEVFDAVGAYVSLALPLAGSPGPERVRGEFVTPEYFWALGARPALGSLLAPEEGDFDTAFRGQVLLSHRLWQTRYQSDPSVIGRSFEIFGVSLQIIGVLEPGFQALSEDVEIWLDMGSLPKIARFPDMLTGTDYARLQVVARSRSSEDHASVVQGVIQAARAVAAVRPEVAWEEATVQTLAAERSLPELRRFLSLLMLAAGLVLAIACFNVAGLHLSRVTVRVQDFAIRKALGATPRQIVMQIFAESGLLALIGAALGLVGTYGLLGYVMAVLQTDWVWESAGPDTVRLMAAEISPTVICFMVATVFFTALVSGIVPALHVVRRDTTSHLREGTGQIVGASGRLRSLGRRVLVAIQAMIAVALLTLAGLLFLDLTEMLSIDPGFEEISVQAFGITSATTYGPEEAPQFHRRLIEEAQNDPGVKSAAIGSCIPMSCGWQTVVQTFEEGRDSNPELLPTPNVGLHFVSPGYFRTLGIHLLEGRDFTHTDTREAQRVAIVSQSLAERLWPDRKALGRRLKIGDDGEFAHVVGVVANARQQSLFEVSEDVYIADYQNGASWGVLFASPQNHEALDIKPLREVLLGVDPGLPFKPLGSLAEHLRRAGSQNRYSSFLVSAIAVLALLLTVLGIFGVATLSITSRARELALRLVVGADRGALLRLVMADGLKPVAMGSVLGAPVAWVLCRRLDLSTVDVSLEWTTTYLISVVVVMVTAFLASLSPVRRVLAIEPSEALTGARRSQEALPPISRAVQLFGRDDMNINDRWH